MLRSRQFARDVQLAVVEPLEERRVRRVERPRERLRPHQVLAREPRPERFVVALGLGDQRVVGRPTGDRCLRDRLGAGRKGSALVHHRFDGGHHGLLVVVRATAPGDSSAGLRAGLRGCGSCMVGETRETVDAVIRRGRRRAEAAQRLVRAAARTWAPAFAGVTGMMVSDSRAVVPAQAGTRPRRFRRSANGHDAGFPPARERRLERIASPPSAPHHGRRRGRRPHRCNGRRRGRRPCRRHHREPGPAPPPRSRTRSPPAPPPRSRSKPAAAAAPTRLFAGRNLA